MKPNPSLSRQVMYVKSIHRKELSGGYLVILLHTEQTKEGLMAVSLDNQRSVFC